MATQIVTNTDAGLVTTEAAGPPPVVDEESLASSPAPVAPAPTEPPPPGVPDDGVPAEAAPSVPEETPEETPEEPADAPGDDADERPLSRRERRQYEGRLIRENERFKRDNDALRAQLDYVTRQASPAPQTPAQPQPEPSSSAVPSARPQQAEYATDAEWIDALTDWKLQQARQQWEGEQATRLATERFNARLAQGRTKYADYDEVIARPTFAASIAPIMADTVRESEAGADLLYYFGEYPDDLARLNAMTPLAAARWLGQIEARLTTPPPPAPRPPQRQTPAPPGPPLAPTPPAPALPPPVQPLSGGGSGMPPLADPASIADRGGSLKAYMAASPPRR